MNSMTTTLDRLIFGIFPAMVGRYADEQLESHSGSIDYTSEVPSYIRNTPPYFIRECMVRLKSAVLDFSPEMISVIEDRKLLKVESSVSEGHHYYLDLTGELPKCTCPFWLTRELPCKHLFASIHFEFISWNDVPVQFR